MKTNKSTERGRLETKVKVDPLMPAGNTLITADVTGDLISIRGPDKPSTTPNQDPLKGGAKYDGSKPRFTLLDPLFIWGVIDVLEHGAKKYHMNNWRQGMLYSRPYNALMRHLHAWFVLREEIDPESGLHHLDEAACNVMFLRGYAHKQKQYEEFDDRESVFQPPNEE